MDYDKLKDKFLNANEELFKEFVTKEVVAAIKRDFIKLNKEFKNIQVGLECMNKHEQLYRDKNCNGWMSHSELRYVPYFNLEEGGYSLPIFTKIIADEYGYDFFLREDMSYDKPTYECKSCRYDPFYMEYFENYVVVDGQVVEKTDTIIYNGCKIKAENGAYIAYYYDEYGDLHEEKVRSIEEAEELIDANPYTENGDEYEE